MRLPRRPDPRHAPRPVVLAAAAGLVLHGIDQALGFRAGPVPVLVTAPAVAALAYRRVRPETTGRRLGLLLGWGIVGSGLAILGVFVLGTSYRLPRPMTDAELVAYDLGLFVWFVLSLTAAYALAARTPDRTRRALAVAAGPVAQVAWLPLVALAFEVGRYA